MIDDVHRWIDNSRYDNWEWYFLIASLIISFFIYTEIVFVTSFLVSLDNTEVAYEFTISEILVAALQGIIIGMVGGKLYSYGDTYFKFITESFDTKEVTFLARVGVMTVVGIVIGLVIPELVERHADYVAVQMTGVVVVVGYLLIHLEIGNWRLWNEAPVLLAGFLLAVVPAVT
jgi:FtsH-binding integral membrane protein